MKAEDFSEAMDVLDNKYVEEAMHYQRKKNPIPWRKVGAAAAACVVLAGALVIRSFNRQDRQKNHEQLNNNTVPTPSQAYKVIRPTPPQELSEEPDHGEKVITVHADWPYYETLEDLADEADYIVYGKVESKRYARRCIISGTEGCVCEDPTHDCDIIAATIYEIEVLDSFGKKTPGDKVEFICLGGEIDGVIYRVVPQMPELEIGGKYALFMNQYGMLSSIQGIFRLSDNGEFSGGGFHLDFDILDNLKRR